MWWSTLAFCVLFTDGTHLFSTYHRHRPLVSIKKVQTHRVARRAQDGDNFTFRISKAMSKDNNSVARGVGWGMLGAFQSLTLSHQGVLDIILTSSVRRI